MELPSYLTSVGLILLALLAGVLSPGPSFVMAARTAVAKSRDDGLALAFGLAFVFSRFKCCASCCADFVHVAQIARRTLSGMAGLANLEVCTPATGYEWLRSTNRRAGQGQSCCIVSLRLNHATEQSQGCCGVWQRICCPAARTVSACGLFAGDCGSFCDGVWLDDNRSFDFVFKRTARRLHARQNSY
jgi:hypothetical protein